MTFFNNPAEWSDEEFDHIFNNRQVDEETLAILQTHVVPLGQPRPKILQMEDKKEFSGIDFGYDEYYS